MTTPASSPLGFVLNGLLDRYKAHVPDVDAILFAMAAAGIIEGPSSIENDHIAFRTLGVPNLGIASLERVFLRYGYTARDWYDFPAKKVTARWYHPPEERHPRVFISQLRVHELSADAQAIIQRYTAASSPTRWTGSTSTMGRRWSRFCTNRCGRRRRGPSTNGFAPRASLPHR